MRPSPALLVAIFVVVAALPVATTAVAAQDGGPYQITSINGTTNQLSVPESELQTAAYESPGVDVGTAVAAGSRRLHQEHETGAFEERFIRANSAEARTGSSATGSPSSRTAASNSRHSRARPSRPTRPGPVRSPGSSRCARSPTPRPGHSPTGCDGSSASSGTTPTSRWNGASGPTWRTRKGTSGC
ncbi:hypothetical protein ACFQH8_01015 [Halomicroarcula sp. GCM10025710]